MPITLTSHWDSQAILSISKCMEPDKAEKWEIQAGKMFFKHRRATFHLESIKKCYSEMSQKTLHAFEGKQIRDGDNSSFTGPLTEVLLFHIDGFFEAERSAHDFILNCASSASILINVPISLHDFYKKANKAASRYSSDPPEVTSNLIAFWYKTGNMTKEFRDCFNHHVSLSGSTWQQAVHMKWKEGTWNASLYLPDNPESRSYRLFEFTKKLDALMVCVTINQETENFLRLFMATCSAKWKTGAEGDSQKLFTLRNIVIGN